MESYVATRGIRVGWRFIVMSNEMGHGGGGTRPNADGPRPFAKWIKSEEMVIRSVIL
jgi:hypothetical protein